MKDVLGKFGQELFIRVTSESPQWFKKIAWVSGVITVICLSLYAAQMAEQINLSPLAFEWIKRIGIACGAVAGVATTAKK